MEKEIIRTVRNGFWWKLNPSTTATGTLLSECPKNLQGFEKKLRTLIDEKIRRGRIEVFFQIESSKEAPPYTLELNMPLADAYLKIFDQLGNHSGLNQELRLETLLKMNDVVNVKTDPDDEEEMGKGLYETLSRGLDSLVEMRQQEGAAIELDLRKRLKRVGGFVNDVRGRTPEIVRAHSIRLRENVQRLCQGVEVDAGSHCPGSGYFCGTVRHH